MEPASGASTTAARAVRMSCLYCSVLSALGTSRSGACAQAGGLVERLPVGQDALHGLARRR